MISIILHEKNTLYKKFDFDFMNQRKKLKKLWENMSAKVKCWDKKGNQEK